MLTGTLLFLVPASKYLKIPMTRILYSKGVNLFGIFVFFQLNDTYWVSFKLDGMLGFEQRAAGLKAQMNPLRYSEFAQSITLSICVFTSNLKVLFIRQPISKGLPSLVEAIESKMLNN